MSRFNTGNPLGSGSPLDLDDNSKNMDLAVNSDGDTFQDRMGKSRLTWTGIVKAGSGDPAIAVDAAARAESAASSVEQNAEQIAQDAAQQAVDSVVIAVDGAVDRAEAAAQAAFVNADVKTSIEAGLTGPEAVAVGEQFQVLSADGMEYRRYRKDSETVATEVGDGFPSPAMVRDVADSTRLEIPNHLLNGDFLNGVTNWAAGNSTLSASAGNMEVALTGAQVSGFARQSTVLIPGHQYLVQARVKVDSADCLRIDIGNSSSLGSAGYVSALSPEPNTWVTLSEVRTAVTASTTFNLIHVYASASAASGKKMTVDYASLIDLTAAFPEGIPSGSDFDQIFGDHPAPYGITARDLINDKLYRPPVTADQVAILTDKDKIKRGEVELFKDMTVIPGAVGVDGSLVTNFPSYRYTGFLDVSMFDKVELNGFALNLTYAFYDADRNVVEAVPPTSESFILNGEVEVPSGAEFFARTMRSSTAEDYGTVSIKGIYSKDKLGIFALEPNVLGLSPTDQSEVVKTEILTAQTRRYGRVSESGVTDETAGYEFSGYLDVTGFHGVTLSGFTSSQLTRFWFDEDLNALEVFDYAITFTNYALNGYYHKPVGAKYFAANLKTPSVDEAASKIHGERRLNTSDFQRKGSSGDASQGWETTLDSLNTQKNVQVYNPLYPDVKPLRILNYGKDANYPYGNNINFDTEIFRIGWGIQIQMNLSKPNYPDNIYSVKSVKAANALLAEWGVEGFSWHVCPPGKDWGERAWMMFKLGGSSVRSNSNYAFKHASMAQIMAPLWTERTDGAGGAGWVENTADEVIDDTIPTRVMLRHSAHFDSPEYFRAGYSNQQKSSWDRFVRARGALGAPTAAQHGDSIHKQVFSVATGADESGNPVLKDVAQIEIIYQDDANPESAAIVFKVWNKITESWEEKLKL